MGGICQLLSSRRSHYKWQKVTLQFIRPLPQSPAQKYCECCKAAFMLQVSAALAPVLQAARYMAVASTASLAVPSQAMTVRGQDYLNSSSFAGKKVGPEANCLTLDDKTRQHSSITCRQKAMFSLIAKTLLPV